MRISTLIFFIILSSFSLTSTAAPADADLSSYSFDAAITEFEDILQTQVRRRKAKSFDLTYTLPTTGDKTTTSISTPGELRPVLVALPGGEYNFFVEFYRSGLRKFRHQNIFLNIPITEPAPEPVATQEPAASPTVTLNWDIPNARENTESLPLSEIGGYEIYLIGNTASGQAIDEVLLITDAQTIDYAFQDLLAGDYYFAIATVDSDGLKSQSSDIVSITLQ